jgi:hypothetical protein
MFINHEQTTTNHHVHPCHGWKAVLELLGWQQETKSKLDDDDRVKTIEEYLMEKAPKSCHDSSNRKELYSANAFPVWSIIP